jgi:hypothetical protein
MTSPSPLTARLADASQAEQPLRNRVAELESQLRDAIAVQDFDTAATAKRELGPAREALAIAEATTASLRAAQDQIDRKRVDEDATVLHAQRAADARRRIDEATERERLALAEVKARHAAVREHVNAIRGELQQAFAAEATVTEARQAMYDAQVELGEREHRNYVAGYHATQGLIDNHPALIAIMRGDFR